MFCTQLLHLDVSLGTERRPKRHYLAFCLNLNTVLQTNLHYLLLGLFGILLNLDTVVEEDNVEVSETPCSNKQHAYDIVMMRGNQRLRIRQPD